MKELYPPGHYYSVIPSPEDLERVKNSPPGSLDGINLNLDLRLSVLEELSTFALDLPWTAAPQNDRRYYLGNEYFNDVDGITLFGMLRKLRPANIIEIGSGYTTGAILDTYDLFLQPAALNYLVCDPIPRRLLLILKERDFSQIKLKRCPVQDLSIDEFRALKPNDILFIDSSHVGKAGSDVNYLIFEVLPHIAAGVYIHFHDIFFPFEYPQEWTSQGIYWNEAYLLRALLMFNSRFEIVLFNSFLQNQFAEKFSRLQPEGAVGAGGSLWLRTRPE